MYFPLYHEFCYSCKSPKKSTHTLALRLVSLCGMPPSYSYYTSPLCAACWMFVHGYATSPRKANWSGPHQQRWEENNFKFHNVTCYTNFIVSCIHVNTTKLRTIMCTLVATSVIIQNFKYTHYAHIRTNCYSWARGGVPFAKKNVNLSEVYCYQETFLSYSW